MVWKHHFYLVCAVQILLDQFNMHALTFIDLHSHEQKVLSEEKRLKMDESDEEVTDGCLFLTSLTSTCQKASNQ